MRRRKPQPPPSKGKQILGLLSSAVPSAATAKKAKPSGKGSKGLALLGAAGGLAAVLKNRQKLPFVGRSGTDAAPPPPASVS